MRKIVSFFAFVAIVISFAACGGNTPEIGAFIAKVTPLSTKVHVVVTPAKADLEYLCDYVKTEDVKKFATIKEYVDHYIDIDPGWYHTNTVHDPGETWDYTDNGMDYDTEYTLFAFYTDGEGVVGDIYTYAFKTMPEYTLNGEFTVNNQGKKVRFTQANIQQTSSMSGLSFMTNQWDYLGTNTGYPRDRFLWEQANNAYPSTAPYRMLSKEEWWYLFKTRPNAEKLFAHATVNDINGLILLPDNWHTPDDINLTTDFDMGFRWDESEEKYVKKDFDGFAGNTFNKDKWATLEFAGAVFLPAPRSLEGVPNALGWYWSSTIDENSNNFVHAFNFKKDEVDVSSLMSHPIYKPTSYLSIRPVREVK